MSRDRLLPGLFSKVHQRFRTPYVSTWIAGFVVGIPAGICDIDTFAELSNIGTLFAFVLPSLGPPHRTGRADFPASSSPTRDST